MRSALFMISLMGMIAYSQTHKVQVGSCQSVEPMQGFDVEQFLGTWYIIEIFDPMNKCMTLNFEKKDETNLKVTQVRELYMLNMLSLDNRISSEGTLKMSTDQPSSMTVRWSTTFWLGLADFTVMDTDYDTYAALFECKSFWVVKRHSAAILSRTPTLDEKVIENLQSKFAEYGVEKKYFEPVSHENCVPEGQGEVEFKIDENTFG